MSRRRAAVAGLAAAAAALGISELLSGLWDRVPSLVLSVANVFIAETPGEIVRWSIDTFGASQKTVLVTGIIIVSMLFGAVLGLAGRQRPTRGAAGFVAFGALGGWAAASDTLASDGWGWLAAAVSATVGIGARR